MEKIVIVALFLLPAMICTSGAVYLAVHDRSSWGWFLFVALLMSSVKVTGIGAGPS